MSQSRNPDDALHVVFYQQAVKHDAESAAAGRPIFKNKDYVKIEIPGGKSNWIGPVKEEHKARFPRHWERYQKLGLDAGSGTPLTELTQLDAATKEMYMAMKVCSVEQLAEMPDGLVSQFGMGAIGHRAMAKTYLEKAEKNSGISKVVEENVTLRAELDSQKQIMADLRRQMDGLMLQRQQAAPVASFAPQAAVMVSVEEDTEDDIMEDEGLDVVLNKAVKSRK